MTDASQEQSQDLTQKQDMEEQQRLDEEEAIDGPIDEREQEIVEYPSSSSDVIDASSDLDLQDYRTCKEKFDDLLQSQYLNNLIQSAAQVQAMSSHKEEDPSQFDFNFKAATLHGHNEEWLLLHVRDFLLRHPDVRGTTLVDFQDELKEKTTYEFDVNEVSKLVQSAGAFGVN